MVLREQPDFVVGMALVPVPEGAQGVKMTGYDVTTPPCDATYGNAYRLAREIFEG